MKLSPLPRLAAVALVMSLVALLPPRLPLAAASPEVRVLYPTDGAVVTSSPALVMIVGPDGPEAPAFQLDGEPLALEKIAFGEAWQTVPAKIEIPAGSHDLPLRSPLLEDKTGRAVWVAAPDLAHGEHTLSLEDTTLVTFSSRPARETDATTREEPVLRTHGSPANRAEALACGQCHQSETPGVLGLAPTPETCHSCHDDVDLSIAHEHVMEFLSKCQTCHDPHAATRPDLLIDEREAVCTLCHEAGHAR